MAYNNYFPMGYQPYYYPQYQQSFQPQIQQPIQQPIQPQQATQNQTQAPANPSSIIWVRNAQEAAMFPLAPNNAVALWDSGAPVIYLKQADASGKPEMKTYDLIERAETPVESDEAKPDKNAIYATKEDLGAVVGVVKDFDKVIGSMKSEIESMKGDLYGIAGKKKPTTAKKAEDE